VDGTAPAQARESRPSACGQLEIVDLLDSSMCEGAQGVERMGLGCAWFDTDTEGRLPEASKFVRTMSVRHGTPVGSPDEIAFSSSPNEITSIERSRDVAEP
jgi:glucose-1-phosphate thymidylyltransferase